jgi:hypothetical protein
MIIAPASKPLDASCTLPESSPRIHLSKSGNTAQTSEQKREAIDGPHFGISMKASLS